MIGRRTSTTGLAALVLATLLAAAGLGPAAAAVDSRSVVTAAATSTPVGADGTVGTDPSYDGPQVTKVRLIDEGRFLEIYWDRYVDEEAAVSPGNVTLTNGDTILALTAKPASGPTDTIFFDRDNKQIAATAANSMARLPADLHLASIAYTGTIDTGEPVTVTVAGSNIRDAQGRPARDATYVGVPQVDYYTQFLTSRTGIVIKADPSVSPAALTLAAQDVDVELGKTDTGVAQNMVAHGCSLAVYAARENAYLVPEDRAGYRPDMYDVEGYGGTTWNGCVSSISERNVLRTRGNADPDLNTGYPDENILIHEFGHAVRSVGIDTMADTTLSTRFRSLYDHAHVTGLWPNTYAISNSDEYFATLSEIWFDVMAEAPDWTDGVRSPINTRAELKAYDPEAYAFFATIYPADLTLPAPWDVPPPDDYHGDFTQVQPQAPTFVESGGCDGTVARPASVRVAPVTGVVYRVGGQVVTGSVDVPADGTVTVTAEAADGYVLATGASTQWSHAFTAPVCSAPLVSVTPQAPVVAPVSCVAGSQVEGSVTIPALEGVAYSIDGSTVSGTLAGMPGTSLTVVAEPADGYAFPGDAQEISYPVLFASPACVPEDAGPAVPATLTGTRPRVAGHARVGGALRAVLGAWSPAPARVRYRWFVNGHRVTGAKGRHQRLKVTAAMAGKRVWVQVRASRPGYDGVRLRSKGLLVRR